VHTDSPCFSLSEIRTVICKDKCLEEYCSKDSCRLFWKQQREIIVCREKNARIIDMQKKKNDNYMSEIVGLRASMQADKNSLFAEDVERAFGKHFQIFRELELSIRNDFIMSLKKYEKDIKERDTKILAMEEEISNLKNTVSRLSKENKHLCTAFSTDS
tara:strand:+ start:1173 stop:1649 length:477 start_codon:yes stop_codon:yes gene_type:complete